MGEPKTAAFEEVCRFIIGVGETAHGYGPNAYRLETYLARLTEAFGYHGVFRSTLTEIHFAFSENGAPWQQMHISSMAGTGLELNRLALLGELVDDLESGKLSLAEASARLDEVDQTPHPLG